MLIEEAQCKYIYHNTKYKGLDNITMFTELVAMVNLYHLYCFLLPLGFSKLQLFYYSSHCPFKENLKFNHLI